MPGSQQHEKSLLIRKTVANFNIAVKGAEEPTRKAVRE